MSAGRLIRRLPGGWFSVAGTVDWLLASIGQAVLRLAWALELLILPVVISGTHRVWEHPFSPPLRFGQRVTATILPPVEVAGLDRRQLAATMLHLERTMKGIALGPDHVAPRRYRPDRDGTWDEYAFVIDSAFRAVASALPHHVRLPTDVGTQSRA